MGFFVFFLFLCSTQNIDFKLALREQLIKHEGYVMHVYKDSLGHPTYGVGHLVKKNEHMNPYQAITTIQLEYVLLSDIDNAIKDARSLVNEETWLAMNIKQRKGWTDFVFNIGYARAKKFKKTIKLLNNKEWKLASVEILRSKWRKQVGRRALTISKLIRG